MQLNQIAPATRKLPPMTANAPLSYGMAAPPVLQTPRTAPNLPQSPAAPGFTFQAPTVGPAPTSTPTGNFQAPNPTQMTQDPYYQYRLSQSLKGIERRAASRGTLLTGGLQARLIEEAGNMASAEGDKIYGRAMQDYTTNRDTNQQNFGQSLASYSAGTGAQLDAGRLNLSGSTAVYDRAYGAGRDAYGDARDAAQKQTDVVNASAASQDEYAQMMAAFRAQLDAQRSAEAARQNEATSAFQRRPMGPSLGSRPAYVLR